MLTQVGFCVASYTGIFRMEVGHRCREGAVDQTCLSSRAGDIVSEDGKSGTLSKVGIGESKGNCKTKSRVKSMADSKLFFLLTLIPLSVYPNCLHTTLASRASHPSSTTVPQAPFKHRSTRPWCAIGTPVVCTSRSWPCSQSRKVIIVSK